MENFIARLHDTLLHAVETALATAMQRQQNNPGHTAQHQQQGFAHQHARGEDSSDDDLAENLFANPQNVRHQDRVAAQAEHQLNRREIQPEEGRWDSGFWVEIPEFSGNLSTEEFLDWVSSIEEILEFKRILGDQCVPLIASRFKNRAMAWWQKIKESRRRSGKPRIDSWERLKKHMRRAFLPYNCERNLYKKLQSLRQGTRTVDEYATDFFHMVARTTLVETEEQLVSRFIGGLGYQILHCSSLTLSRFRKHTNALSRWKFSTALLGEPLRHDPELPPLKTRRQVQRPHRKLPIKLLFRVLGMQRLQQQIPSPKIDLDEQGLFDTFLAVKTDT